MGDKKSTTKRRKLHERDLIRMIKAHGEIPIFACYKVNKFSMEFWCPLCWKYHWHGWQQDPYIISGRIAHCGGQRWIGTGKFHQTKGYSDYCVFWDGTERQSQRG